MNVEDEDIFLMRLLKANCNASGGPQYRCCDGYECAYCVEGISAVEVNVLPPIETGASCFNENSTSDSEELRRLTLSPQA